MYDFISRKKSFNRSGKNIFFKNEFEFCFNFGFSLYYYKPEKFNNGIVIKSGYGLTLNLGIIQLFFSLDNNDYEKEEDK